MNIDPLLRWLRLRGSGSWQIFSNAVDAFEPSLVAYSLARGLSEHALVEFDFSGGRRWSATGTSLVNTPLPIGAFEHTGFATSGWGGSHDHITAAGMLIEPGTRTIHTWSGPVQYTHALRVLKPETGWPRSWEPTDSRTLRTLVPTLRAIESQSPVVEPPRIKDRLAFYFRSTSRTDDNRAKKWVKSRWEPAPRPDFGETAAWRTRSGEVILSRAGACRVVDPDVAKWIAFRSWLDRNGIEAGISYDAKSSTLTISAQPALPILYVRAFLLNGAREDGRITDRIRVFRNVDSAICDWFVSLLGLSPL
jgi:hypothetical protein